MCGLQGVTEGGGGDEDEEQGRKEERLCHDIPKWFARRSPRTSQR